MSQSRVHSILRGGPGVEVRRGQWSRWAIATPHVVATRRPTIICEYTPRTNATYTQPTRCGHRSGPPPAAGWGARRPKRGRPGPRPSSSVVDESAHVLAPEEAVSTWQDWVLPAHLRFTEGSCKCGHLPWCLPVHRGTPAMDLPAEIQHSSRQKIRESSPRPTISDRPVQAS
jgi:hypothetical protein